MIATFANFCIADKSAAWQVLSAVADVHHNCFSASLFFQPLTAACLCEGKWPILGFTAKPICIFSSKYAKHKTNFWDRGIAQSNISPYLTKLNEYFLLALTGAFMQTIWITTLWEFFPSSRLRLALRRWILESRNLFFTTMLLSNPIFWTVASLFDRFLV